MIRIGIVATSSVIPKSEFEAGLAFLKQEGFQIEVHESVLGEYYFYPASDEDRARALIEYSSRPDLDVIWCGRGGYGATHLIPYLDRWKKSLRGKKPLKKTLLGFSDITALLEWYRTELGWETIHAPMPSLRTFPVLNPAEWKAIKNLLRFSLKLEPAKPFAHSLKPVYLPKSFKAETAPIVGGNLSVWNALLGTPHQGSVRGKFLFLEEIQENLARINRMTHHLEQAGGLKGCKGIILGDFMDCKDSVPLFLSRGPKENESRELFLRSPPKDAMSPLRNTIPPEDGLNFIFQSLGKRLELPVFSGLPVGHGPHFFPLYLGKKHELKRSGVFRIAK
jgi:muramoyltetrapeptide carboxypeptidase